MLGIHEYDHSWSRKVNKFLLNHGQKHLTSIFIPSPKKGDVTTCPTSAQLHYLLVQVRPS